MNVNVCLLEAPPELHRTLEPLLPELAAKGVDRLMVFTYSRPGEPRFWTAYLFVDGRRHTLGTPDLLALPLEEQLSELVRQLEALVPKVSSLANGLLAMPNDDKAETVGPAPQPETPTARSGG